MSRVPICKFDVSPIVSRLVSAIEFRRILQQISVFVSNRPQLVMSLSTLVSFSAVSSSIHGLCATSRSQALLNDFSSALVQVRHLTQTQTVAEPYTILSILTDLCSVEYSIARVKEKLESSMRKANNRRLVSAALGVVTGFFAVFTTGSAPKLSAVGATVSSLLAILGDTIAYSSASALHESVSKFPQFTLRWRLSRIERLSNMEVLSSVTKVGIAEDPIATDCVLCREDFSADPIVRTVTPCGHSFHLTCVDLWFCRQLTCPLCRHDLRASATAAAVPPTTDASA